MQFPEELKYTEDHEWVRQEEDLLIVGITDFAQDALNDVVYVEIDLEIGTTLEKGEEFGSVEAVKTVSELFMPVSGEIVAINEDLLDEDNAIWVNESPYEKAWMIKIKPSKPEELEELLDVIAYKEIVA